MNRFIKWISNKDVYEAKVLAEAIACDLMSQSQEFRKFYTSIYQTETKRLLKKIEIEYPNVSISQEDAFDMFWDSVEVLWGNLKHGKYQKVEGSSLVAYFRGILLNELRSFVRNSSKPSQMIDDEKYELSIYLKELDELEHVRKSDAIERCLKENPREVGQVTCRTLLSELFSVENEKMSAQEIALKLNISYDNLRQKKSACLKNLKDCLTKKKQYE